MRNSKFVVIVFLASFFFMACNKDTKDEPKVEQEKVYELSVKLNKVGEDSPSMAAQVLEPIAILKEKAGKRVLTIQTKPLVFGGLTGILTDLVYLKKRAKKIIGTPEGHNAFEFEIDVSEKLDNNKQESLTVKLFVPAMNLLYDEEKGPEDQGGVEADIVIDHKTKKEKK